MKNYERIEKLQEAQEKLSEAIELIEDAVEGTDQELVVDRYIIGHLRNWRDGNNPFDDTAISRIIEKFEEDLEEEKRY